MKYRKGSSGFHAFDRRSGVNLLMDEIDIAPDQWSDAPRHVAIALTNACDLSCSHCYAPKTRGRLNKGTTLKDADFEKHYFFISRFSWF